jgi:hypothetical protein
MRRLAALCLLAAAAVVAVRALLSVRRRPPPERVVIGYDDGTETILEPGSRDHELLVGAAAEAVRP